MSPSFEGLMVVGTALRAERARAEPARSSGAGRLFSSVRRAQATRARAASVRLRGSCASAPALRRSDPAFRLPNRCDDVFGEAREGLEEIRALALQPLDVRL